MKIKQGKFSASPNCGGMLFYARETVPAVEYTTAWERCNASLTTKVGWRRFGRKWRRGISAAQHSFVVQVDQPEWQLLLYRLDVPGIALAGRVITSEEHDGGVTERSVEVLVAASGAGRQIRKQSVFAVVYERGASSYTGAAGKTLALAQRKARRLLRDFVFGCLPSA